MTEIAKYVIAIRGLIFAKINFREFREFCTNSRKFVFAKYLNVTNSRKFVFAKYLYTEYTIETSIKDNFTEDQEIMIMESSVKLTLLKSLLYIQTLCSF